MTERAKSGYCISYHFADTQPAVMESILKYSEFAAAIILFSFAAIQFIYRHRQRINFNIAGIYFFTAYEIATFWLFKSEVIFQMPVLTYTDITSTFALGPFVYFYYKTIAGFEYEFNAKYFLHFVPALVSLCIIIPNNIINEPAVIKLHALEGGVPLFWISPLMWWLNTLSILHMTCYFAYTLKATHGLVKEGNHKSIAELRKIFFIMVLITAFGALMLVGVLLKNIVLTMMGVYSIILMAIAYFIFSFRHPEFTQKVIRESRVIRYENSLLKGVDHQVVLDRLDYLMAEEKVYIDCELTVQKLSTMLKLTPHHLSGILNAKKNMNFRSLVNSYRIKEAMNQMAEHPEMNILEIALASGFNSKSSFNAVFLNSMGTTPSDYRKSLKSDEPEP